MTRFVRAIPGTTAALISLGLLAGCGKDYYKPTPDPLNAQVITAKTVPPAPTQEKEQSLEDALGVSGPIGGPDGDVLAQHNAGRDYERKCDIYWKLNWVKKQIDAGRVPSELPNALRDIAMETKPTDSDDKKPLIGTILQDLQSGLDAHRAGDALRQHGVDPSSVAWGIGRISLESKLSGVPGSAVPASGMSKDARQQILSYEEQFHASPISVKRESFGRASHNIERLGNMLGMLGREENTPGGTFPRTRVDVKLPY